MPNEFSDLPSLDDTQGLESYINGQQMAAAGVASPDASNYGSDNSQEQQPAQQEQQSVPQYTDEQLARILAQVDVYRQQQAAQQRQQQPYAQQQPQARYTATEIQFINDSLARGYDMQAINAAIRSVRAQNTGNADLSRRIDQLQQYIANKEYQAAEQAFLGKLQSFGDKWGLSEDDLVTFGNVAYSKGINIAQSNVDLETAFRAVFPEQYAIRSQRMSNSNASQIYGGSAAAEQPNAASNRATDAYVEQFLKGTMGNYYPQK